MGSWDVLIPLSGMLTGIVFTVGMFRTVRYVVDRRYEAKRGDLGGEEVLELRERIEYLEQEIHKVEELEDRLDFAERLLSKGQAQGDG